MEFQGAWNRGDCSSILTHNMCQEVPVIYTPPRILCSPHGLCEVQASLCELHMILRVQVDFTQKLHKGGIELSS